MRFVFIDTETTSLRPDRRLWEIALIARDGSVDESYHWFIRAENLDLGNADLNSLNIGRFYQRHPDYAASAVDQVVDEHTALRGIERLTRGAASIAGGVWFDAEGLANRMRASGICPSWDRHIQDWQSIAIGFLRGRGLPVSFPYKSDELSRQLGVEPPSGEARHTALGDAEWAMRVWDVVMAE